MIHPSELPVAPQASALTGLPLIGPLVVFLDKPLADLGMPTWLRDTVEFVILLSILYHFAKWLLHHLIPWLVHRLVKPALGLVAITRASLLLPDFIVTRLLTLRKIRPPVLVYSYGNAVLSLADGLESFVRSQFPAISNLRRFPKKLITIALLAAFLLWNGTYCITGTSNQACVSPSTQWRQSLLQWVKELSAKGNN